MSKYSNTYPSWYDEGVYDAGDRVLLQGVVFKTK